MKTLMCGFIAQLVEHRTGIAEVTSSNRVEALIFQASFFHLLRLEKFTAIIILHFEVFCQSSRAPASSVNLKTITGVKLGKLASLGT